jgi:hypothetical protein
MIKITKVRRNNIILSLVILPFFLVFAGWVGFSGNWWAAIGIIGFWGLFFLWVTSYLFMALVVFCVSIYSFSQQQWGIGIVCLLLTPYLYFASKITDKDIKTLPERMHAISPSMGNTMMQ